MTGDILKHELVPKHEIMKEKKVEEMLQKYNITKGQVMKIFNNDPVVKKLEAEVGNIIKITKKGSESPEEYVVYRVVVPE